MRILVVEDEPAIAAFVNQGLTEAGYAVDLASDGAEALHWVAIAEYDLVLLDVMLPDRDGLSVCREIRARGRHTPVLMVTARDTVDDRVAGLDSGADDYLVKPFALAELLARVRALLRRAEIDRPAPLSAGDLTLDVERQAVSVRGGAPIRLTSLEFRLIQYLLANAGHTIPADRLTSHVWGYRGLGDKQLLKQLVHRLRQKVEQNPTEPQYVVTVAGVGYVLQAAGA